MIITIGRKPFKGAVVDNATKNHCGGINIDSCRIGRGLSLESKEHIPNNKNIAVYGQGLGGGHWDNTKGRFPANLILQHLEGCVCVGQSQTKGKEGGYSYTDKTYKVEGFIGTCKPMAPSNYGGEIVEDWNCVEGCPIRTIDQQGGYRKTGAMASISKGSIGSPRRCYGQYAGNVGFVSRYFKDISISKGGRNEESE